MQNLPATHVSPEELTGSVKFSGRSFIEIRKAIDVMHKILETEVSTGRDIPKLNDLIKNIGN